MIYASSHKIEIFDKNHKICTHVTITLTPKVKFSDTTVTTDILVLICIILITLPLRTTGSSDYAGCSDGTKYVDCRGHRASSDYAARHGMTPTTDNTPTSDMLSIIHITGIVGS